MKISENTFINMIRAGIVLVVLFFLTYNFYLSDLLNDRKELKENIDFWGAETVDFFNNFNVDDLVIDTTSYVEIKKVFIIDTHLRDYVKGNMEYNKSNNYIEIFGNNYTRNINKANVIIWLRTIKGKQFGKYTNGETAYRLNTELNFIEKKTNKIFKTKLFIHEGQPKKNIQLSVRNLNDYNKTKRDRIEKGEHNIYFGKRPINDINNYIRKILSKS